MKCKTYGHEIEKMKTLIIEGIEYETETHDFNKKLSEIKILRGWRLWTAEECIKLHNSKYKYELNLKDCWFFIEQPFNLNKKNNYVAGFVAYSYRADLDCYWNPGGSDSSLGVRFCRKVKK